jgi:hypothetical protein
MTPLFPPSRVPHTLCFCVLFVLLQYVILLIIKFGLEDSRRVVKVTEAAVWPFSLLVLDLMYNVLDNSKVPKAFLLDSHSSFALIDPATEKFHHRIGRHSYLLVERLLSVVGKDAP